MRTIPVIFLSLFIIFLTSSLLLQVSTQGFKRRSQTYQYYYKPYHMRTEGIHPAWWKRGGVDGGDNASTSSSNVNTNGARDPLGGNPHSSSSIPLICSNPNAYWDVDGKKCVPIQCLWLKEDLDDVDCACILPGVWCRNVI